MRSSIRQFLTRFLSLVLAASLLTVSFGSAANARFISPDDWDPTMEGVGTNRYAYSQNDPVNKSDPNGHIWGLVGGVIGGLLGGLFGGTKEANAPGPNDKISNTSDSQQLANMAIGASGGSLAGRVLGEIVEEALKDKESKKQVTEEQALPETAAEVSASRAPEINIEEKIQEQMGKRGWDETSIKETVEKPDRTVNNLIDKRWDPTTGTRRSDPATGYVNKDGSYVVRNDINGTIVQISDKTNPSWKSPF